MVALMGPARTKLMLMGGQKITADEALSYGLIDRIVEDVALLEVARAIAADTLAAKAEFASRMKAMCR